MAEYVDRFWSSLDGLRLHCREYGAREYARRGGRPPVVCLPGLTRNARDFEGLAARLAGEWQVFCPEMRGRGDSAYARDSATYNPVQYVEDLTLMLDNFGITRFVVIGTSLGGVMAMILGMSMPERIVAAVLNDIGPDIEQAGLDRIRSYVGQGRNFPTWMHAARALEESFSSAFPDNTLDDWLVMAKRLMTLSSKGRIVFDYDMKIAEPFSRDGEDAGVDLWPGLEALAGKPLLFLRGGLSDILSAETLRRMKQRVPDADTLTLPRVGHAPTLDEPAAAAAIDRLLAKVA